MMRLWYVNFQHSRWQKLKVLGPEAFNCDTTHTWFNYAGAVLVSSIKCRSSTLTTSPNYEMHAQHVLGLSAGSADLDPVLVWSRDRV
ncbi:hypothetical protein BaRGS_00018919 [Batillaria attramentaria]|uniref:Uncharacterized protein n=1 Tax=Batillaria attramentaria TaxID=370345 RepID=A0ABD0KT05_9CAEN